MHYRPYRPWEIHFGRPFARSNTYPDSQTNAAKEDIQDGKKYITPYWRTLKSDGKINEKYPGGIPFQKKKLVNENHKIVLKGKKYFVENFENKLAKL